MTINEIRKTLRICKWIGYNLTGEEQQGLLNRIGIDGYSPVFNGFKGQCLFNGDESEKQLTPQDEQDVVLVLTAVHEAMPLKAHETRYICEHDTDYTAY